MPHQQPSVDDYDSDESRAQDVHRIRPGPGEAAGKRTPRPYGAGVEASSKARRGSDSGYSSITHNSTNSTQYSHESRTDQRPGSGAGTTLTDSTLKPNTPLPSLAGASLQPRRSTTPEREKMSKKNRPRRDEGPCTDPDCMECRMPPQRDYPRNPAPLHHRSQSYSRYPTSPNQAPYATGAFVQPAFPPTIPRPRASTTSRARPLSYYGGMPTDGYYVPIGPAPGYAAPLSPDGYYPAALPPAPFQSYATIAPSPNMQSLSRTTTVSAPVAHPHYEGTRPKLHPIRTDNYVSRSRPLSVYGTPLVSYEQSPYERSYERAYDRPYDSAYDRPYDRHALTQSAGANAPPQDYTLFDYEDDRRRMPPPSRTSRYSPDEPSPSRQGVTRQSRPSLSGRPSGYDPRREDYDDFDPTAKLPTSRNPSQRRPSSSAKSSPYSSTVDRVIESRSGRRSTYSAEEVRAKTERAVGESERYQAEVAGRSSYQSNSSTPKSRDAIDQIPLQKSMSRRDSESRRNSHSRSRTGSSHDGRDGGPVKINVDKDGGYSISVNDGQSVRMRVVPQEDGAKEIIIGGNRNDTHYRNGSMKSTASSRTGRSGGPRDDDGRKGSRSSRRRSEDEP